jgi:hypothetical protein
VLEDKVVQQEPLEVTEPQVQTVMFLPLRGLFYQILFAIQELTLPVAVVVEPLLLPVPLVPCQQLPLPNQ